MFAQKITIANAGLTKACGLLILNPGSNGSSCYPHVPRD